PGPLISRRDDAWRLQSCWLLTLVPGGSFVRLSFRRIYARCDMYRLHVLGTPQLTRLDSGEAIPVGRQGMALLAALAIAGPRGLTRERITALFWGEADDRQAGHSLRQLLYRIRQMLGQDVVRGDHTLTLNDSLVDIDLWRFR